LKKAENIWIKRVLILLGFLTLVLGVIGIFLPLLPTTPFLLLSAYFFSKSSDKFYNLLLSNKYIGKYITDFREGNGITRMTKISSLVAMWLAVGSSVIWFIPIMAIKILLMIVAFAVTYYLLSLKTLKEN
tara:strand:- start:1401 stop:1790 length:390 start_codon:yes stop_codon:yes gene_type:complete